MSNQAAHGTCVILGTRGVLLRGPSGAGKSALAGALLEKAAGQGHFAALVSDDRVYLRREGCRLIASAPGSIAGKLEARGLGILELCHERSARVHLVTDLVQPDEFERLPEEIDLKTDIEGVQLARLAVPARTLAPAVQLINQALAHFF